jgi:transcriptional regulator with XRE-family HTH domain
MTLGTKLFNLRTARDMSLDKLAFELEISKTAINNWEADKAKPSIENLLRLCEFYNTDVYKLLEEVSNVNFSHAKFKGSYASCSNFTINNTTSPELIDSIMTNQTKITELFSQQNELILKLLTKQ